MPINRSPAFLAAALAAAALPFGAAAQEEGIVLDTITITPLRRAASLQQSTSSVTVIGKAEIERSASPDLQSLLKSYNGISIRTNGGQGASSDIYMRGMSSRQVVVLVNGVRTASATAGMTALANIPLSAVARVEIARGAHSAQYGADAMGGVVNIITTQGGACGERPWCASLTTGVTHPWGGYASGSVQGRSRSDVDYAFGAAVIGTQGYDFTAPDNMSHEPDRDGFLQGAFNFSLAKDVDWGRLYADGLLSRGRNQYDSRPYFPGGTPPPNEADSTAFAGKAGMRIDHADDWSSTLEVSSGVDHSRNFRKKVSGSEPFDTRRYGILASTEKRLETGKASHVFTGGVEAYREEIGTVPAYDETRRDLTAVFGQYSLDYARLRIDGGLRYDHNGQFGTVVTYNLGASYAILPDLVLRASHATGFRAPTFNELYYPGFANPDLQPEKSRSYEIGVKWRIADATSLDMAFYQTRLDDAIMSMPPAWLPFNVARARITGFEAALDHDFNARWSVKTALDVKKAEDEETGKALPYRERYKAAAEIRYRPTEKLDLTARLFYGGSRYADADNRNKLPAYVTADFVALYALDPQAQLKFSVENIFDKDYQSASGYIAPGRTFNIGLTRSF